MVQVACLGKPGVRFPVKGEDGFQAEWTLTCSQRTGFGCSTTVPLAPEGTKGDRQIDLKPGQVMSQRMRLKPWGPVYGVMPHKAYQGLIAIQAELRCRMDDLKTVALPKSPRIYVVVEDRLPGSVPTSSK